MENNQSKLDTHIVNISLINDALLAGLYSSGLPNLDKINKKLFDSVIYANESIISIDYPKEIYETTLFISFLQSILDSKKDIIFIVSNNELKQYYFNFFKSISKFIDDLSIFTKIATDEDKNNYNLYIVTISDLTSNNISNVNFIVMEDIINKHILELFSDSKKIIIYNKIKVFEKTISKANFEKQNNTDDEIVKNSEEQLIEDINDDISLEDINEPIKESVKEEVKESIKEEVKEPIKEEVEEPVKEEVKKPIKEEVKEPIKEEVEEPVKEEVKEPVKEVVKEPTKEEVKVVEEQIKEAVKEPVKEVVKEPIKEAVKEESKVSKKISVNGKVSVLKQKYELMISTQELNNVVKDIINEKKKENEFSEDLSTPINKLKKDISPKKKEALKNKLNRPLLLRKFGR